MNLKRMTPQDEVQVQGWFETRGLPFPPDYVRGNMGFVVERDGVLLAAGYLIITATQMAFAEFFQTNPKLSKFTQAKAYRFLVVQFLALVKDMGFRGIFGLVPVEKESIHKFYKRLDGKSVHFIGFYKEVG